MDKWVVHPWQWAFISVHLVPLCSDVPGFKGESLAVPWVVIHIFPLHYYITLQLTIGLIPHACKLSSPSNTFIHTLFPCFMCIKSAISVLQVLIPLMKVLDWTETFGIYSKLF